jgi:hypothetical protein
MDVIVFVVFFAVATYALSHVYAALFSYFYPFVDHHDPGLSSLFVIAAGLTSGLIYFVARLLLKNKTKSP